MSPDGMMRNVAVSYRAVVCSLYCLSIREHAGYLPKQNTLGIPEGYTWVQLKCSRTVGVLNR